MGTTIFATVLLLGIAIIFHEFGHFIVAKWLKIRVEQFSIGFPPRLIGFKMGETDYCISALPLGGYVKVTGQDPTEELTGADYEFNSRPPWQRMLVVLAGPVMNIITAYFLIVIAFMFGIPTQLPRVDTVTPNTAAAKAGLQIDDLIVSVNGSSIQSSDQFDDLLAQNLGKNVSLTVSRGKELVKTDMLVPKELDDVGVDFSIPAVVGIVQPNKPAARAGLQTGDEIVSINGQTTNNRWQDVSKIIRSGKGAPLTIVIKRNGQLLNFNITPEYSVLGKAPLIGITPKVDNGPIFHFPLGQCFIRAWFAFERQVVMTIYGIYEIAFGKIPLKEALGGPQTIANIAGQSMQLGVTQFLGFVAAISIMLGIMNLLPIPVMDGGHMLFYIIETIRGKALKPKTWEIATKFGFAVLVTLMSFVVVNDFIGSGTLSNILRQFH